MTLAERHQFILNRIQQDQYINVVELCKELKVSSVTIRKDLKLLEDKNLLFRTHGGATLNNPYAVDRPVNEIGADKQWEDEQVKSFVKLAEGYTYQVKNKKENSVLAE